MTTVAACQLTVADLDPEENLGRVRDRIGELPDRVELAVFPELMLTGFVADERIYEAALDPDGPTLATLSDLAADHDLALLVGYVEAAGDEAHNAAAYVAPDGDRTVYRKRHLWAGEERVLTAGEDLVTVDTPAGRAGVFTCYDLNYVDDSAALARPDVDLLLVPGAWPAAYSENWTLLVRARALDGVRWAVGASRTGRRDVPDARRVEYAGRSLVVRPDGGVAHQLDRGPGTVLANLDRSTLERQRKLVGVYDG